MVGAGKMVSGPKQRKYKRPKVLIKRTQHLGNLMKNKSYNALCGKLKSNNNSLAKALSDQKQENQFLYNQNCELNAQVHALGVACNKRDVSMIDDAVMVNIQRNAKETLNLLVTMSEYVSNIIGSCQEYARTPETYARTSIGTAARQETNRRLSTKSPARGVVKPMVSGHTITRPTINLSRINMQRVNNMMNLSIIEEVSTTPNASPIITQSRTPTGAPTSGNRIEFESRRVRRLPERIPLSLLRVDDDEEQRLNSRNSRLSGRLSERLPGRHSARLSNGHTSRRSGNALVEKIRSPRVTLNDVSKLLQNSQTINVQMLAREPHREGPEEVSEAENNSLVQEIQYPQTADPSPPNWEAPQKTKKTNNDRKRVVENKRNGRTAWEDPLEGPSWLLNDSQTVLPSSEEEETEVLNPAAALPRNIAQTKKPPESNEPSVMDDTMEFTQCVNVAGSRAPFLPSSRNPGQNDRVNDCDREVTVNLSKCFVTNRRRWPAPDEDIDDYTLMRSACQQAPQPREFDLSEFRLPTLEAPIIAPAKLNDSEPELTTNIQRLTQFCPQPAIPDPATDESIFNQSDLQLPQVVDSARRSRVTTPEKRKRLDVQRPQRKLKMFVLNDSSSEAEEDPTPKKKPVKRKKKQSRDKDPSSAKVVLQKLKGTGVRGRSPTPEPKYSEETEPSMKSSLSSRSGFSKEFDRTSSSMNGLRENSRPRRQKAPTNLKEPSTHTKLRREF